MNRSGFTLIEVLTALGLSIFISAIGFMGVQAFGKAVVRAKQFSAETQCITASLILAGDSADASSSFLFNSATTGPSGQLACPLSWPQPSVSLATMGARSVSALSLKVDQTKADFIGRANPTYKQYDAVPLEVLGQLQP